MADRIAELTGTFIVPGVSRNRRLYTAEHARSAVARMKARIADPAGKPVTMLTHHGAGDDSTRIAARVTDAWVDETGTAWWRADVADTDAGRDIAALVTPDNPYLRNVSLRGWWLGDVRTVMHGGDPVETADDIEVDGIDFTKSPGVDGARITSASLAENDTRTLITESVEARLMTETSTTEAYADPGYLSDGAKRLPLSNRRDILAAWAAVATTEAYTPNQTKRIRGRIKTAAEKIGFDVVAETDAQIAVTTEALEEAWASMNLDTGPGEVRVSGYTNDPTNLTAVARKVALAALAAQAALDPDQDGDIDIDGTSAGETDTTSTAPVAETTTEETTMADETKAAPASVPAPPKPIEQMTESELREYAASLHTAPETTAPAAETTPEGETTETEDKPLTKADVAAIVAEAVKALVPTTETAPTAETTETQPEVTERDALKAEVTKEVVAEVATLIARSGLRKGLIKVAETDEPAKPLHTMTDEEFRAYRNDTLGALLP